jgi:hypothetical protein
MHCLGLEAAAEMDPLRLDPLRQLTPLAGSKLYFLLERCLQPARQFLYL